MNKFTGKRILLGLAAAVMMAITALPSLSPMAAGATAVKISGSTTVYPIVNQAATAGSWTDMQISGGGSGQGVTDVLAGTSDIGMSSSKITDATQLSKLDEWVVGKDMMQIIVKKSFYDALKAANGGADIPISKNQLFALYTKGSAITSTTWKSWLGLTGTDAILDTMVVPVARVIGSGTRGQFDKKIGGTDPAWAAEEATMTAVNSAYSIDRQAENQGVKDIVLADSVPNAHCIGYVGMGFIDSDTYSFWIKSTDSGTAIEPIVANYSSYLFSRQLYVYTLKKLYDTAYNMRAMDFVEYLLSPSGQAACPIVGFISVPRSTTTTPCWWDIAGSNKKMDTLDFSALAATWNSTGTPGDPGWVAQKADLNNNGKVDVPDFSKLSSLWGKSWDY